MIYLRFNCCVKGVFWVLICWFLIWCVFVKFWLISNSICVFGLSVGIGMLCRCGWWCMIFGVGILFWLLGMLFYLVIIGSFMVMDLLMDDIKKFEVLCLFICWCLVYEVSVNWWVIDLDICM